MQHVTDPDSIAQHRVPLSVQCSTGLNKLNIVSNDGGLAAVRNCGRQFRRRLQF